MKKNEKNYERMQKYLYPFVFESDKEAFQYILGIMNNTIACTSESEQFSKGSNPIVLKMLNGDGFLVDSWEHGPLLLERLQLEYWFDFWEATRAMGYEKVDGKYVQTRSPEELIAWFETGAGEKLTNRMKQIQSYLLK